MSSTLRSRAHRDRPRPGLEVLEGRALLANAGAIDPTFGQQGSVAIPIAPAGVVLQEEGGEATDSAGRILLGGSYAEGGESYFLVERLEPGGSPDPSFGQAGRAAIPVSGTTTGLATAVAVQPDGSIVEAGMIEDANDVPTYGAIRVTTAGTLDTSFGTGGIATLPTVAGPGRDVYSLNAAAITADGHILLVGHAEDNPSNANVGGIYVARLDADGTLDATFGTAGIATASITLGGLTDTTATGVVIQPSGRVVVSGVAAEGYATYQGQQYGKVISVLVGLTASGAPDPTFGAASSGGVVVLPAAVAPYSATGNVQTIAMATRADGTLDLDVMDSPAPLSLFGKSSSSLVQLTADGGLDPAFGAGGLAHISAALTPGGIAIEGDGKIVVAGSVPYPYPISSSLLYSYFAAGRFDADGTTDATFGQPANPGVEIYPTVRVGSNLTHAFFDPAGHLILTGFSMTSPSLTTSPRYLFEAIRASTSPTITPAVALPPAALDGLTDVLVYLPASGVFADLPAGATAGQADPFGPAGPGQTIPAVADYLGNGRDQVAAYLPQPGEYVIQGIAGVSAGQAIKFGSAGAGATIPVPADYQGTGKADVAVYLVAQGAFAVIPASGVPYAVQFGIGGAGQSIPAPADYYGTGQDDIAVYLAQSGKFAIQDPTGKTPGEVIPFGKPGLNTSIPVPGDYDGSGKVELAVYVPSLGAFFYRPADGQPDVEVKIGTANSGELPVPGDYDGSGHDEFAVYDPTRGFFAYHPAAGGADVVTYFGGANDGAIPVAAPAGSLPEFAGPGSGNGAIRPGSASPLSTTSTASTPITLGKTSAVPAGPTLASVRLALSPVNQAADDSSPATAPLRVGIGPTSLR